MTFNRSFGPRACRAGWTQAPWRQTARFQSHCGTCRLSRLDGARPRSARAQLASTPCGFWRHVYREGGGHRGTSDMCPAQVFTRPVKARTHTGSRPGDFGSPFSLGLPSLSRPPPRGRLCVGVGGTLGAVQWADRTHLWVRGLPALRWGHGIQGALERRGDRWSRGAPGGQGGRLVRADRWSPAPEASAGEQLTARFALWGTETRVVIHSGRPARRFAGLSAGWSRSRAAP